MHFIIKFIIRNFSRKMNSINNILGQKFSYLSIDFEGLEFQEQILKQITLNALKEIDTKIKLDTPNTKELINLLENDKINEIESELGFKFPHKNKSDHWHLTTFFKSRQRNELSEESKKALMEFEKNKIVSVQVLSLIYIPDKILILHCKPDCSFQNKYAHVTLLIKNVNPAFSNIVLETIFENDEYFKKDYDAITSKISSDGLETDENSENVKHCVLNNLDFNEEDCFMYIFNKEKHVLNGKMKFNF